jgi:hypothetical protein
MGFLEEPEDEFVNLWLCDRIIESISNEPTEEKVVKIALTKLKKS